MFENTVNKDMARARQELCRGCDTAGSFLHINECAAAAQDLRALLRNPSAQGNATVLCNWVVKLQHTVDMQMMKSAYLEPKRFHRLVQFVLLSDLLKNSDNLKTVLLKSCELIVPSAVFKSILHEIKDAAEDAPDKGQVSRARLTIDVAHMLFRRCMNWVRKKNGYGAIHWLTWDSSPQYNRDFELATIRTVMVGNMRTLMQAIRTLQSLWRVPGSDPQMIDIRIFHDMEKRKQESELMAIIKNLINVHAFPATLLGFGCSSFGHRLRTLTHAQRLEEFTNESCSSFVKEFRGTMQDYGIEHLVTRMEPVHLRELCPWFADTSQADIILILEGAGIIDRQGQQRLEQPNPMQVTRYHHHHHYQHFMFSKNDSLRVHLWSPEEIVCKKLYAFKPQFFDGALLLARRDCFLRSLRKTFFNTLSENDSLKKILKRLLRASKSAPSKNLF